MKHLFYLLLLLISSFAYGQDYDFIIDPIEVVEPSMYETTTGNYAPKFHETYQNRDDILNSVKRKVVVFIHDTAGELNNPYLSKAAKNNMAATFTGEDFPDGHGHGTHVAGCVGAYSSEIPLGIASTLSQKGLLWLIPYKVLMNNGGGRYEWVEESLRAATKKGKELQSAGFFVIHNLSLGGGGTHAGVQSAVTEAREAGQLVIIAAGNSGGTPIGFPGRANNANAIAAVDALGNRASFSSYGKEMYMAAAGVGILSTKPGTGLVKMSGTSMASPTFAGFAAVIASIHDKATANQIERFLAKYTGQAWDQYTGYGVPKYSFYIGKHAISEKDAPIKDEDPIEEEPTREKRELTFEFSGLEMFWKPMSGRFETLYIDNLKLSVASNKYDESIFDAVQCEVDWFFTNRALVVKDEHGFIDAGYWTARFTEMLINRRESNLSIKIESITVHDASGRSTTVKRKGLSTFNAKIRLLVSPEIYNFNYKW